MNDEVPWWVYPIVALAVFLALRGGLWLGENGTERTFQEQAVKAGVARWTNNADGKPIFQYKEPREIK